MHICVDICIFINASIGGFFVKTGLFCGKTILFCGDVALFASHICSNAVRRLVKYMQGSFVEMHDYEHMSHSHVSLKET